MDAAREVDPKEHKGYGAVFAVSSLALLPFVSDDGRSALIAELRARLDAIDVPEHKARAIADSLEYLHDPIRGELLHEAITIAQSLPDCRERAWQLGWLLPHVADGVATELLDQALRAAVDISLEDERAKAIAHLAKFFSLETARAFAKDIKQDRFKWSWGRCLNEIAVRLSVLGRTDEPHTIAKAIRDDDHRRNALAELSRVPSAKQPVTSANEEP